MSGESPAGLCYGRDAATATTYAWIFKITGGVITRSEKETRSNETIVSDDDTGRTLFGRVDCRAGIPALRRFLSTAELPRSVDTALMPP